MGDGLDTRVPLYEGLLSEAYGDADAAIARYTALSSSLAADDRSLGEALYWLGHGLYARGRVDEARQALVKGIGTGNCPECRNLLETLEIDQASVSTLPAAWSFDDGKNPLFQRLQDRGCIRIAVGPDDDPALQWTTTERQGDPDWLVLGLRDPKPAPETLRFDVRSEDLDAVLDVEAEDVHGRTFTLPVPILVSRGTPRRVVVALDTLVPTEPTPPLDPRQLVLLSIVDSTATRSLGSNRFWLDDVEIR